MSWGPSFDDVPASAAPNRQIAASYAYRDRDRGRSRSPTLSDTVNRPSLESPYRPSTERWSDDADMDRRYIRDRSADLPPLQANNNLTDLEEELYKPVSDEEGDSYDLLAPGHLEESQKKTWNLEKHSQALFSKEHLQLIFGDPVFLLRFTSFLGLQRPQSVPILVHYLDSLKALRAIHYANAILEGLDEVPGLDFTAPQVDATANATLLKRATDAFDYLVREELPAFITHQYIQIVSVSITARITGMLAPHLREASEGLAEVFCLTDPSRPDNPIVFASEEFNRTTQYGMNYILGRNCRFLQGPFTNPLSVRRIRDSVKANRQHQEVFLNYRRDGSPFMNLLMTAPLCDSRGVVRYFIGAQIDVSGLVKDCSEMESLDRLLDLQTRGEKVADHQEPNPHKNDELRELSEMLNQNELSTIYKYGGRMHKDVDYTDDENGDESSVASGQPRLLLKDPNTLTPPLDVTERMEAQNGYESPALRSVTSTTSMSTRLSGRLSGVYNNYLLVRPYPSLRVLFASPSQRIPGILQSPFMSKIGGSNRVREELTAALADGRGVTAKVRWISKTDEEGRNRWIHCTPLLGINGQVGVWMVVIVDDERHKVVRARERKEGRTAPPVAPDSRATTNAERQELGQKARVVQLEKISKAPKSGADSPQARYGYSTGSKPAVLSDRITRGDDGLGRSLDIDDGSGSVQSFGLM